MYAVIKQGGHQFRVQEGDMITVDLLPGNAGDKLSINEVLMIGGSKMAVGAPLVKGASVSATIKEHTFNDKILVFKYRRRKNYKRTRGHKQPMTVIEIGKISG